MIDMAMLLCGEMWIWRIWKAVECFKLGLMGYPIRNMETLLLNMIELYSHGPKDFQWSRISEHGLETVFMIFWILFALVCIVYLRLR